jgi:biopolymer transport protein ExbB
MATAGDAGAGALMPANGAITASKMRAKANDFINVVFGSGWLGILIWAGLFLSAGAGVYFSMDGGILVRSKRIMPPSLIKNVTQAMQEGDVLKALKNCENEPGPLASIFTAGFSHVEDGFEIIQESVATTADLELEKIMQHLTRISVCANVAPMLGLLGTVQGMIMAFSNIAEETSDVGIMALAIAQALYTTAAGLLIAIPCVLMFYSLRNTANKSFLQMEALTMKLIKSLRKVEIVNA